MACRKLADAACHFGGVVGGRGEEIKEYVVGTAVFGRGAGFDPRTDPVVRTEARRLRAKLREYYDIHGNTDALEIDLPKGSYCPVFLIRGPVEPAAQPSSSNRLWIIAGLGATALLVTIMVVYFVLKRFPTALAPAHLSIAVLPLVNLSGHVEQEYFADGMTEALTTELAKLGNLRVISTTSAMQYKNKKGSLPTIAAALKVNYIVEGSVTRAGNRVRVRAQLIQAPADHHRWADDFDSDLSDILRLQSEVARSIAREINVRLVQPEAPPAISARAVNSEAYLAYLRGRYHWYERSPQGIRKSLKFFNQAVEYDFQPLCVDKNVSDHRSSAISAATLMRVSAPRQTRRATTRG
jgi:TolB-like protein